MITKWKPRWYQRILWKWTYYPEVTLKREYDLFGTVISETTRLAYWHGERRF